MKKHKSTRPRLLNISIKEVLGFLVVFGLGFGVAVGSESIGRGEGQGWFEWPTSIYTTLERVNRLFPELKPNLSCGFGSHGVYWQSEDGRFVSACGFGLKSLELGGVVSRMNSVSMLREVDDRIFEVLKEDGFEKTFEFFDETDVSFARFGYEKPDEIACSAELNTRPTSEEKLRIHFEFNCYTVRDIRLRYEVQKQEIDTFFQKVYEMNHEDADEFVVFLETSESPFEEWRPYNVGYKRSKGGTTFVIKYELIGGVWQRRVVWIGPAKGLGMRDEIRCDVVLKEKIPVEIARNCLYEDPKNHYKTIKNTFGF